MNLQSNTQMIIWVLKILATIILLLVAFVWTGMIIAFLPLMAALNHAGGGKSNISLKMILGMIPTTIVGTLLWRMWSPDGNYTRSEKEYFRGIREGHEKGSYDEGRRQGYAMVSREEELTPVGVYDTRKKKS